MLLIQTSGYVILFGIYRDLKITNVDLGVRSLIIDEVNTQHFLPQLPSGVFNFVNNALFK
jgi:hypothetical protein